MYKDKDMKVLSPILFTLLLFWLLTFSAERLAAQDKSLKIVFLRHAERPDQGNNLNCRGLNRSMQLPAVLYRKFQKPSSIYVPALSTGEETKRARMFQTISPFAIKLNLSVNSSFAVDDAKHLARALLRETGTVLVVWEHKNIVPIIDALGYHAQELKWESDDFDTLLIITFPKGRPVLKRDHEGLNPSEGCPF